LKTSKDRYITTHVGSMLRSPEIVDYNAKIAGGQPYDKAGYEATLKKDVAEVVKNQANCGIDVVSDGEFGKPGWLYVTNRMSGFEARDVERPKVGFRGWDAEGRFRDFYDASPPGRTPTVRQMVCTGPVKYTDEGRALMRRDVENFKAALKDVNVEEAFLPVVATLQPDRQLRERVLQDGRRVPLRGRRGAERGVQDHHRGRPAGADGRRDPRQPARPDR
jgi:5-methyltetrahydropteroyltriglutamate--homocysteine methyltransferase